jgi:uncharacterized protein
VVTSYVPRLVDRLLVELLAGLPAVAINGPRGSGKTTTARRLASSVVRLDRELEAGPVRADPDGILSSLEPPVLLDEWQAVPEVLEAVKRLLDDGDGPGRFILTGSVRAELVAESWAATGRVVRLLEWGLCERELAGLTEQQSFFDRLIAEEQDLFRPANVRVELRDYIQLALRGSYPEVAQQPSVALRRRWLASYVDQLVLRDAALHDENRDPVKLRRYLVAIATNTAGVPEHKTLHDAAGITRKTASRYDDLLSMLFVAEEVSAWHSNRLNRLTRSPKRYLTESALVGPLLGVDERAVVRNGDLLGRLIDTFVMQQLRPEVEMSACAPRLHHLRHEGGDREIDIIAELADGRVIGIEVKASSAPKPDEARHLVWLRKQLGDQVAACVLFHTGPTAYTIVPGVQALPISSIWSPVFGRSIS